MLNAMNLAYPWSQWGGGTRFLAGKEANITKGYQDNVLRTRDGGLTTARTSVYDILRASPAGRIDILEGV